MFEAHDVLHPRNIPIDNVFIDTAHPTPGGHQRLADALAPVIQAEVDK
jgi:lysophospholipase L1-like esterase